MKGHPPHRYLLYSSSVKKSDGLRGTAITLGVFALLLIAVGIVASVFGEDGSDLLSASGMLFGGRTPLSGLLIRTGALLGAVSLVLPSVRKPSTWTLLVAAAGLALVLFRPALIWVALAVWVVWLILNRQHRPT